jgi:hypothetical protein
MDLRFPACGMVDICQELPAAPLSGVEEASAIRIGNPS